METWLEVACNECADGRGEDDMQDGPAAVGGSGGDRGPALLAKAWEALNAAAAAFGRVKPPHKDMKERVESAGGRVYALACAVLQGASEPAVEDGLWGRILGGWTFENYEGVMATLAARRLGGVDEQTLQWVSNR